MTPLQIEILLHYHTRATDYPDMYSQSQDSAIRYFVDHGFLTESPPVAPGPGVETRVYEATAKLHAYCDALCRVPEPRQEWIVDMEVGSCEK